MICYCGHVEDKHDLSGCTAAFIEDDTIWTCSCVMYERNEDES